MIFKFLHTMAIGDAFGMKYEFVKHDQNVTKDDFSYGPHPKYTEYNRTQYTDDTQMSLANAELLLTFKNHLQDITQDDLIEQWLKCFKRDPRAGYSKHMYKILSETQTVQEFRHASDPKQGVTSGGAMRAAPFGFIKDLELVKSLTKLQAQATHDTPSGITSALAVSLSVYHFRNGGTQQDLTPFLENHLGHPWNTDDNGFVDHPKNGVKIVSLAINAVINTKTLSDLLLYAINQEAPSDADTICAIAMAIASNCDDITDDLPELLKTDLEQGQFGSEYLKKIDQDLNKAFPKTSIIKT